MLLSPRKNGLDSLFKDVRVVNGRLIFLPLLLLARQGRRNGKTNTGNNFPRKYQRITRNYYRYWC